MEQSIYFMYSQNPVEWYRSSFVQLFSIPLPSFFFLGRNGKRYFIYKVALVKIPALSFWVFWGVVVFLPTPTPNFNSKGWEISLWAQPWKCLATWNTAGCTQLFILWAGLTGASLLWSHAGFDRNRFPMMLRWVWYWPPPLTRDRVSAMGAAYATSTFPLIGFPRSWKEIQQNLRAPEEKEISWTLLLRMLLVFCELPLEESDCS